MLKEIQLQNVCKSFGEKMVLDHLELSIPLGTITCIQGPSGQGKTTLLRIVAGLIHPDEGFLYHVPEKKAFVFQEDRLCEDYTVLGNIRMVTGRKKPLDQIRRHLEQLELDDCLRKKVRELSGGMKRRVSMARAFLSDADLILLDEPFKGLDPKLREKVMEYVKQQSCGKTVLCVSHDPVETAYLGGKVIVLNSVSGCSEKINENV